MSSTIFTRHIWAIDFEAIISGNVSEGCRVGGFVNVSKVDGSLRFAPGQIFQQGYLHAKDIVDFTFKNFDNSHIINLFAFGPVFPVR